MKTDVIKLDASAAGSIELDEAGRIALSHRLGEALGVDYADTRDSRKLSLVSPAELLFGTNGAPTSGEPQPDTFGGIPLFWGTVLIGAVIAMIVAIPIG